MGTYYILLHIIHMLAMIIFCLVFGLFIKPEVNTKYGEDTLLNGLTIYVLTTSILLSLDVFVMEIMVALAMLPVLTVSSIIY